MSEQQQEPQEPQEPQEQNNTRGRKRTPSVTTYVRRAAVHEASGDVFIGTIEVSNVPQAFFDQLQDKYLLEAQGEVGNLATSILSRPEADTVLIRFQVRGSYFEAIHRARLYRDTMKELLSGRL